MEPNETTGHTEDTLSEVIEALRKEGYTEDFNLKKNCIVCQGGETEVGPEDFTVDRIYRFEGMSNPDDAAILYAISSEKKGVKGVLVNGYGIYSQPMTDEMALKLKNRPE